MVDSAVKCTRNNDYFICADYPTEIVFETSTATEINYLKTFSEQKILNSKLITNRKDQAKKPIQQKMYP